MTDTPHTCGLAMMLEVKVQEDRFYLPRHDAEQLAGAMCRARSAGMVREEGSVHRHSQHLLLSLPACVHRFVKVPSLSTGAPTSHARQQLPATRARGRAPSQAIPAHPCARQTRTQQGRAYRREDGGSRHRRDRLQGGGAGGAYGHQSPCPFTWHLPRTNLDTRTRTLMASTKVQGR